MISILGIVGWTHAALAALPIAVVLVAMVVLRRSAATSAAAGLAAAIGLAVGWFWPAADRGVDPARALGGALAEGGFTAATIAWVVFGALALFDLQERLGAMDRLREALGRVSDDPRIIALLIGWFFALFTEGAAGFGTAIALSAPFLVAFGFGAIDAVVLSLIGHAAGKAFGAVGIALLAQAELVPLSEPVLSLAAAQYVVALGWISVVAVVWIAGGEASAAGRRAIWGWAALAAAAYLVPMYLTARFVGPELPTMAGALVGGVVFAAIYRWVGRRGQAPPNADEADDARAPRTAGVWRAASPYLLLIVLVAATRLVGPLDQALAGVTWRWQLFGRFEGSVAPLRHPGTLLMVSLVAGAWLQGARAADVGHALARGARQLVPVLVALVCLLGLARLMVHAEMVDALAVASAEAAGAAWPALAPAVGVLGAFITGSCTASNILFSEFQYATAVELGLSPTALLGAQSLGASVGNIVSPHNIVAGSATVGIAGQEGAILRRTLPAVGAYLVGGGALALALVWL